MHFILFLLLISTLLGCQSSQQGGSDSLFRKLDSTQTNINFANTVVDDKDFNVFNYRNFYNGGGVAIGDVNNDGLSDVFLNYT